MRKIPSQKLQAMLESGQAKKFNYAIRYLHHSLSGKVKAFIIQHGGTKEDAEEVLTDGLLVVDKYVREQRFEADSNIEAFLYRVCKFIWYGIYRKKGLPLVNMEAEEFSKFREPKLLLESLLKPEQQALLNSILTKTGEDCRKLLIWSFYDEIDAEELVTRFKLGSKDALKNKKSRCMKKLRELIEAYGGKGRLYG